MLLTYKVGHTHEVGIVLNRQYWVKKQLFQWNDWIGRVGRTLSDCN